IPRRRRRAARSRRRRRRETGCPARPARTGSSPPPRCARRRSAPCGELRAKSRAALSRTTASMRERRFVNARRARWDRLAALTDRAAARGVRSLPPDEIDELALAYRAATSDLAIATTRGEDPAIVQHLNRLTARAHAVVYVASAQSGWSRLVDFVLRTFPREVRRSWAPIAFCAAVTIVSALVAFASVAADPQNAHALLTGVPVGPTEKP